MKLTMTKERKAPSQNATEKIAFVPSAPRADLLPDSVRHAASDRRSRKLSIAGVGLLGLALAGVWVSGQLTMSELEEDLDQTEKTAQTLSADLAVYSPVTNLATQTQALTETVENQTAEQVDHAEVLARFLAASAGAMEPTSVVINTATSSACVPTDPFNSVPLSGCISFAGTDLSGNGAADLVRALGTNEWFSDPFIPSIGQATGTTRATLTGTVGLTVEAYATPEQDGAEALPDAEPLPTEQD